MSRSRLYTIILLACSGGSIWLWMQSAQDQLVKSGATNACLIKAVSGVPCPSCGTTRSIIELLNGHLISSLQWNPMGVIVFAIMVISPIWIIVDLLLQKESFLQYYSRVENRLRSKWIAIPAIALVLINWAWNICKGL